MSDDNRVRRPPLDRTAPIRDGSTGAPAAGAQAEAAAGDDPLRRVIARSVELGYRVVDEYIAQGQRAARLLNERQVDAEAATREAPEMFSRMLRSASDFASLWLDFASLAQAPRPREAGAPAPPAPGSAPGAAPPAPLALRLEVRSARRTAAQLELRSGARAASIAVHELRSADPAKPRLLARCEKQPGDDSLVLVVDVPDTQPPGTYSGLLIDAERSVPVGSLSITVDP